MKPTHEVWTIVLCLILMTTCDTRKNESPLPENDEASSRTVSDAKSTRDLAAENDSVWVIITHVRPNKRDVFEKFMHDIFFDSAEKLNADEQRLFRQTRILHPTRAEADGTYNYFFIMDPYIPGGDYSISSLMSRMYDKADAEKHLKMYNEAVIRQTQYMTVQSRH